MDGFAWIRAGHAAVSNRSQLLLFGGVVVREGRKTAELLVLDTDAMAWRVRRPGLLGGLRGMGGQERGSVQVCLPAYGSSSRWEGGWWFGASHVGGPEKAWSPALTPLTPRRCSPRVATGPAPATAMCWWWTPPAAQALGS